AWERPAGGRAERRVRQSPVCVLIAPPAHSRFVGPARGLSTTVLEGRSWGFGVLLAPAAGAVLHGGGLRDLAGSHRELDGVAALAGLTAPLRELMAQGPAADEVHAACCALVEERIARLGPPSAEDLL